MGPGTMLVLTAECAAQGQPITAYKDGLGPIPSTQHDGKSRGHTQATSGPPGELLSSGHAIRKSVILTALIRSPWDSFLSLETPLCPTAFAI
jgi:hypothetical protein